MGCRREPGGGGKEGGVGNGVIQAGVLEEVLDGYKEGVRRECSRQKKVPMHFFLFGPEWDSPDWRLPKLSESGRFPEGCRRGRALSRSICTSGRSFWLQVGSSLVGGGGQENDSGLSR